MHKSALALLNYVFLVTDGKDGGLTPPEKVKLSY